MTCEEGENFCAAWIDGIVTKRGCATGNEDLELLLCRTDNCNSFIFPPNRKRCHHCDGSECVMTPGELEVCVNYDENDLCYVSVESK